jgi:hypothetical protein
MGRGRGEAVAAGARIDTAAGALGAAMAQGPGGSDTAFRVVAAIGGRAISPRFTDYACSAQAVMAVDTLLNARSARAGYGKRGGGDCAHITRAYGAVATRPIATASFRVAPAGSAQHRALR